VSITLDGTQKHFLRLTRLGMTKDGDGWAKVSPVVWPFFEKMPTDLVECELTQDGWGRARLTSRGEAVLDYMP
jgi:hypothetical protein